MQRRCCFLEAALSCNRKHKRNRHDNSLVKTPMPTTSCSLPHTSETRVFDAVNVPLKSPSRNLARKRIRREKFKCAPRRKDRPLPIQLRQPTDRSTGVQREREVDGSYKNPAARGNGWRHVYCIEYSGRHSPYGTTFSWYFCVSSKVATLARTGTGTAKTKAMIGEIP